MLHSTWAGPRTSTAGFTSSRLVRRPPGQNGCTPSIPPRSLPRPLILLSPFRLLKLGYNEKGVRCLCLS